MLLAFSIFLVTLLLVIWQPKGLGIGWSASFGALLALLFGVIQWQDIPLVWHIIWNASICFIAIIIISFLLDEAGFFQWAALHIVHYGKSSYQRLFCFTILLGALVSAFFANDGAALILTPIVVALLNALKTEKKTILAFVMGAGFIADSASLPLVVSNLVNIVSADYFSIDFARYASVMLPVNLVSLLTSLAVLVFYFKKDIQHSYSLAAISSPQSAIKDHRTFVAGWISLFFLLLAFFYSDEFSLPLSLIASLCALILSLVAHSGKVINVKSLIKNAPWQIVIFSLAMYLVVFGLKNAGLTEYIGQLFRYFAQYGIWVASLGTGFVAALLSSVTNNLPSVLLGVLSIDASGASASLREAMAFANIIGCDLGPKITPIGSLATLLWLHVLSKKNVKISWGYYFKVGISLTIPTLLASLIALALRLSLE